MSSELYEKVIEAYRNGSGIAYISECFNITYEDIISILISYKESNRYKRTFTEEFKRVVSERDISGVTRKQIAMELDINASTVKKACEKFGQAFKDLATSENEYTRVERELDISTCPSCNSRDVNEVDDKTTYCKSCGSEYIHNEDHVLRINWEYLDE